MQIDREYVRRTLVELVRIDSVNPSLVPGAAGERRVAEYLAASMRGIGLAVECYEPEPGRVSVVGRLAGTGGGRSLMLNGHADTVGVEGMAEPFSGDVRDGRVYGRGAFDMKGSLAACLGAAKALAESGVRLDGDLLVAAVADEEYGSLGTIDLLRRLRPDGAIVTEATALDLCLAHKGYLWIEVAVEGRAAHGSKFQHGIDANLKMGAFLHELAKLEAELRARRPHPLVGPPSLHVALLAGGSGLSTYAAQSKAQVERRTIPGETEAQAVAEIQAIVDRLASADPQFRATVRPFFVREPFAVDEESRIVRTAHAAAEKVRGRAPAHIGDTPWMDAALFASAGVDTVILGPEGAGAHASVEWVDLDSVYAAAEVFAETAMAYTKRVQ